MQLHQLKPKHKLKKRKRVGRGGKRGTYSGRGIKGQKSRAGRKLKPLIREMIKRYPKLKGYRFRSFPKAVVTVNIKDLDKKFKSLSVINPKSLLKEKLIHKIKGKIPKVKILGKDKPTKALTIKGCDVSKGAKAAIEKSGGTIKLKTQNAKRKTTT